MGNAKPRVDTNLDGVSEVVRDMEKALLVPADDELALANAMVRLLKNFEWASELGWKSA